MIAAPTQRSRIIHFARIATILVVLVSAGVPQIFAQCDCREPSCGGCSCGGCVAGCGPCGESLRTRPHLTGDLWGMRPALAEHGIVFDVKATQFYQGVAGGGNQEDWEYGGKVDYFGTFDGGKLGLWKGFGMSLHAETRFGQDVNGAAGQISPPNVNMLMPSGDPLTSITQLLFQQAISPQVLLVAGKMNAFDLFDMVFQTGRGIDGFMNTSMVLPVVFGRTTNLSIMAAGVMKAEARGVQSALLVYDTNNAATNSGFDDLFDNGAVVLGLWRKFHEVGCLPGYQAILGNYSNRAYTSVDPSSIVIIPGQGIMLGQETGSWTLGYVVGQSLWQDRCNPKRNIGLLTQLGLSDGNPNPVRWSASVGFTGNGLLPGREQDTLGVGYFYMGLSGEFKQLVSPLVDVRNPQGVEIYYRAAVTPWFAVTADLQVIDPANLRQDTTTIAGLRATIDF